MRRIASILAVFFVWSARAHASPIVTVRASSTLGAAPLTVTLTASGDAAAYHWDFGDHAVADGPVVQHQYGSGRFAATVTATAADGSTAQASVVITSAQLTLSGPKVGTYGRRAKFHGRMVPALKGAPIALYSGDTPVRIAKLDKKGRFSARVRQTAPATYSARYEDGPSDPGAGAVRPGRLRHPTRPGTRPCPRTRSPSRCARAWTSLSRAPG